MRCIVSGGTGFIGRQLVARLQQDRHEVAIWTRGLNTVAKGAVASYPWDPMADQPSGESLEERDAVFHLAGETVAQKWNDAVKQKISDSRVLGTRRLVAAIDKQARRPSVLVCASAIGLYGDRGDEVLPETAARGQGFLAEVCQKWEAEADRAAELGVRVVKLRIGFVLGKDGGALEKILPVFKLGGGGNLGSGKQWMPWVHANDVVNMFVEAAENRHVSGVWNATSPNPVKNAEFTKTLAAVLHRPAFLPVPAFALKLGFGEFGQHMLDSARVVPDAALKAGYHFRYPVLREALQDLIGS
jgi:uncharacterized protein (TIGR01777 family)